MTVLSAPASPRKHTAAGLPPPPPLIPTFTEASRLWKAAHAQPLFSASLLPRKPGPFRKMPYFWTLPAMQCSILGARLLTAPTRSPTPWAALRFPRPLKSSSVPPIRKSPPLPPLHPTLPWSMRTHPGGWSKPAVTYCRPGA